MPLVFAILFPFSLWAVFYLLLDSGGYAMDQGLHKGSFFPLLVLYSVFGYVILVTGLLVAVFSYNHLGMWPALVLLVSGIEALLFSGALLAFYESYLHYYAAHEKSNYTRGKYALVLSLGVSAVVTFVTGLAMSAVAATIDRIVS